MTKLSIYLRKREKVNPGKGKKESRKKKINEIKSKHLKLQKKI